MPLSCGMVLPMQRTKTDIERSGDYEAICGAIRALNGGLKEPELEAICGLSERRVMLAVRWATKLGYLEINAIGEVVIAGWKPVPSAVLCDVARLGSALKNMELGR